MKHRCNFLYLRLTERRQSRTDLPTGYVGVPVLKTGWATRPCRSAAHDMSSPKPRVDRDAVWALELGNGSVAGPTTWLFFMAGPGSDAHGRFGSIPTG